MPLSRRDWRRLGRVEIAFLLAVVAFTAAYFTGAAAVADSLLGLIAIVLGIVVFFRATRRAMKKAIWRLRNRLIAAYLFIAVVPVVLITVLLGLAGYAVIEQMSIYLVNRELDHREATLLRQAEASARFPMRDPETAINRFRLNMRNSVPGGAYSHHRPRAASLSAGFRARASARRVVGGAACFGPGDQESQTLRVGPRGANRATK